MTRYGISEEDMEESRPSGMANSQKFAAWSQLIRQSIQNGQALSPEEALNRLGIHDLNNAVSVARVSFSSFTPQKFVDWLLSDMEYCSHTLLLAKGNVLTHSTGVLVMGYLWGKLF